MYPNENTIINDIQRGSIKKDDLPFVCQAVQNHFKNLRQVGAMKDSNKKMNPTAPKANEKKINEVLSKAKQNVAKLSDAKITLGELSKMSKEELIGLGLNKGLTIDPSLNVNEIVEIIIKG